MQNKLYTIEISEQVDYKVQIMADSEEDAKQRVKAFWDIMRKSIPSEYSVISIDCVTDKGDFTNVRNK